METQKRHVGIQVEVSYRIIPRITPPPRWGLPGGSGPALALTSVAATLPFRSRETKRLTMGLLILWVARMRARGHQKLNIFLMVASPCREKQRVRP